MEHIQATYHIESPLEPQRAAEAMAGEQSSGTFLKLANETNELRERHAARVISVKQLDSASSPFLQGAYQGQSYTRAEVTLSWPLENVGASLPNLMAMLFGNLSELRELSGIILKEITLPKSFIHSFSGPKFGIAGTRKLASVERGPLIGTIIKPSVGLSPQETADLVKSLIEAGIDFIKDDELIADPPYSPLSQRVPAVMRVINEYAQRTGRKPMYAFNITGNLDEMRWRHDLVHEHEGSCVMASMNWIGLASLEALHAHTELPIHGHRNGWGLFYRSPQLGMAYSAYQKLLRLAGADHLHVNGLASKFAESDEEIIASARACLKPLHEAEGRDDRAMPVFSSAQTIYQAAPTFKKLGSTDLIYTCGGGIMGHPSGVAAGCRSIRKAWEAAVNKTSLFDQANKDPDLAEALQAYRNPM